MVVCVMRMIGAGAENQCLRNILAFLESRRTVVNFETVPMYRYVNVCVRSNISTAYGTACAYFIACSKFYSAPFVLLYKTNTP